MDTLRVPDGVVRAACGKRRDAADGVGEQSEFGVVRALGDAVELPVQRDDLFGRG